MSAHLKEAPYGSWKSAITTSLITSRIDFVSIFTDENDVYWTEMRPDEEGRYVIVRRSSDNKEMRVVLPDGFSACHSLNDYGGASAIAVKSLLFFSNLNDQRVYVVDLLDGRMQPITQPGYRYAYMEFDRNNNAIVAVREDMTVSPPVQTIVAIDLKTYSDQIIIHGHDFYSSPRISPRGDKIAFISWKHPNMPWDHTELWIYDRETNTKNMIAGRTESIMEPCWSPDNVFFLFFVIGF